MFIKSERSDAMNIEPKHKTRSPGDEQTILRRAYDVLTEATGLTMFIEPGLATDARLRIVTHENESIQYDIYIKPRLTKAALGVALRSIKTLGTNPLIIADFINPKLAEMLKDLEIPFLDAVGNAYLNVPPIYVFIKGQRPLEPRLPTIPNRAFHQAGARIVAALLMAPTLIQQPFRAIAEAADVSLGTVAKTITDLKRLGYVVERGEKGRRLARERELVDRWVIAYTEVLRPKLILGHYRAETQNWWKNVTLTPHQTYWGGETAANMMGILRPHETTVYVRLPVAKFLVTHHLRHDPEGDTEVIKAFWRQGDEPDEGIAPPLVVYADLIATGDPRNVEAAQWVYEHKLHKSFG